MERLISNRVKVLFYLRFFRIFSLVLYCLSPPDSRQGSISTEREKQTLSILLTTSQSSLQIISGKLLSSIAFLLLLIVAALPIYSLVFLFGGISPKEFVFVFLYLFVTLLAIGSVGVMFSTIIRRTVISMIATYSTMLFLTIITGFLFLLVLQLTVFGQMGMSATKTSYLGHFLASINPAILMASLMSPSVDEGIKEFTSVSFPILGQLFNFL